MAFVSFLPFGFLSKECGNVKLRVFFAGADVDFSEALKIWTDQALL